jgi:N-acetylglutamate synthase-like GNAT family acetyltransferase
MQSAEGKEGYLYGLAVQKSFHRNGAGRALTKARVDRVRDFGGSQAIALAMFWNINFFRKLGFDTVPRDSLSSAMRDLSDFRDVRYRRSAVVRKSLDS